MLCIIFYNRLDFNELYAYAKSMARKKKSTFHSYRKWYFLFPVFIALLVLSSLIYRQYNSEKQVSVGFAHLDTEFASLKKQFEKVSPGWSYLKGCYGQGTDFDRDKATSCSVTLYKKSTQSTEKIGLSQYASIVANSSAFKGLLLIDRDQSFIYSQLPSSTCTLSSWNHDDSTDMSLSCSAPAKEFYFPRIDK